MDLLLRVLFVIVVVILLIKLWNPFVASIKGGHGLYKVLITPFLKFIKWEWALLKVIVENIKFERPDIFISLRSKEFVGRVFSWDLPQLRKNRVIRSIFIISTQLFIAALVLEKREYLKATMFSNVELVISHIMTNLIFAFFGLVFATIYFNYTKNKVGPEKNVYITSSLGMEIRPMDLKSYSDKKIEYILKWIRYEDNDLVMRSAVARKEYCYPELLKHFMYLKSAVTMESETILKNGMLGFLNVREIIAKLKLKLNKKSFTEFEKKRRNKEAFVALITLLHINKDIKATVAATGHGGGLKHGLSVLEHTLNTAEQCLSNNKIISENIRLSDFERKYLTDVVVLAALGHDIGKIKCWIDKDKNEKGELTYRRHHQNGASLIGMIEEVQRLDNETRDYIIDSIYFADKTDIGSGESEPFFKDRLQSLIINMVYSADIQASEAEGVFASEESIIHEYKQKILMALREVEKMSEMSYFIKNRLYINANKFVEFIFHLTGQNIIRRDYTQDPLFKKMILPILSDAGLITEDGLQIISRGLSMVFIDVITNKQVDYFQKVLMLKNEMPENVSRSEDRIDVAYVESSNVIVKLVLNSNGHIQGTVKQKMNVSVTEDDDWEHAETIYQKFLKEHPNLERFLDPVLATSPDEMYRRATSRYASYQTYEKDGQVLSHEEVITQHNIQKPKILLPKSDGNYDLLLIKQDKSRTYESDGENLPETITKVVDRSGVNQIDPVNHSNQTTIAEDNKEDVSVDSNMVSKLITEGKQNEQQVASLMEMAKLLKKGKNRSGSFKHGDHVVVDKQHDKQFGTKNNEIKVENTDVDNVEDHKNVEHSDIEPEFIESQNECKNVQDNNESRERNIFFYEDGIKLIDPYHNPKHKAKRHNAYKSLNEYLKLPKEEQYVREQQCKEEEHKMFKILMDILTKEGFQLAKFMKLGFEGFTDKDKGKYVKAPVVNPNYIPLNDGASCDGKFIVYLYETPTINMHIFKVMNADGYKVEKIGIPITGCNWALVQMYQELKLYRSGYYDEISRAGIENGNR